MAAQVHNFEVLTCYRYSCAELDVPKVEGETNMLLAAFSRPPIFFVDTFSIFNWLAAMLATSFRIHISTALSSVVSIARPNMRKTDMTKYPVALNHSGRPGL